MISYWERESLLKYDQAIVGGGLFGLWTAYHLKQLEPASKIVVLERGLLSVGASTKNAGFACFGSLSEIVDDIKLVGEKETLSQIVERYEGIKNIQQILGDQHYEDIGGYELLREHELTVLNELSRINDWLRPYFKKDVFIRLDDISRFGFNEQVKAVIYNQFEGAINTGEYMVKLIQMVQQAGVIILTGAEVNNYFHRDGKVVVEVVNHQYDKQNYHLVANKICVCTNAMISKLVKTDKFKQLVGGRGQIIVTQPIKGLKFRGTFHFDQGYYYFRSLGDRVLFGGGRNIDLAGETTVEIRNTDKILDSLKKYLKEMILQQDVQIDICWSGIMSFMESGHHKQYLFEEVEKGVFAGNSCFGMGVAMTYKNGWKMAQLINRKEAKL